MMKFLPVLFVVLLFQSVVQADEFPVEKLRAPTIKSLVTFEGFPEGPSYRLSDGSLFFSGNVGLRRVDKEGELSVLLEKPSGGGTHFLPDGSVLHVGGEGLHRFMPDGRIFQLVKMRGGNDITMGIHKEVYFSVPKEGIFRLTAGKDGKLVKVSEKGCNGLDVDPAGKFLYVHRAGIRRHAINGPEGELGPEELVYRFPKGMGGADGCTFDAWGNLYSVRFKLGRIAVIDPRKKAMLGEIDLPVKPASNVTFGGEKNETLFVTAGVPRLDNCCVLKIDLGITGFPGHVGGTEYPVIRLREERGVAFGE